MSKDKMKKGKSCISVDQSAGVEHCDNVAVTPITAPPGPITIKVPVTLAEIGVSTSLVANIHFPDPVLEIKDIKKRVKIIQCRLMTPTTTVPGTFSTGPFQLFIKGFVRKNIQYATPCTHSPFDSHSHFDSYSEESCECVASQLRSLTVDVPFQCVTTVTLTRPVQLPLSNARSEFDFFRAQNLGHGFPEKDQLLSSDLSQFHQQSTQFYNELPFCELLESNIIEWDEATDREPLAGHAPFEEGVFQEVVEKMFLQFTIKVLQNQQVAFTTP